MKQYRQLGQLAPQPAATRPSSGGASGGDGGGDGSKERQLRPPALNGGLQTILYAILRPKQSSRRSQTVCTESWQEEDAEARSGLHLAIIGSSNSLPPDPRAAEAGRPTHSARVPPCCACEAQLGPKTTPKPADRPCVLVALLLTYNLSKSSPASAALAQLPRLPARTQPAGPGSATAFCI